MRYCKCKPTLIRDNLFCDLSDINWFEITEHFLSSASIFYNIFFLQSALERRRENSHALNR